MGTWARSASPARSLAAKCQTKFVFPVRTASFGSAGASRTGEQRSDGKLAGFTAIAAGVLPASGDSWAIADWPDEVSRPPGRKRFCAGLDCLRPSECSETLCVGASRTGVHRSGLVQRNGAVCKSVESGSGCGLNRAGTCPERLRGSVGSVKPGCLLFQSEER
jgi:hypothetical protein